MPHRLAKRMANLGTETAFEVLARAKQLEKQGRSVVHLEIGEPDFDTPANIVRAGAEALQSGFTHYSPSPGMDPLRQAIAKEITRTRHVEVAPTEVAVFPGGKPVMFQAILALVDPGDEVIYPNPGFPIYESMIRFVEAVPVPARFDAKAGFALDVDALIGSITDKTRLLILNTPSNPTGGIVREPELKRIAEAVLARENLVVLADEIYSRILYDGEKHASLLSIPGMKERTILLDGFSKTYAMTGWRLGYCVAPQDLIAPIARLTTNSTSCTAAFTQMAGVEALEGPQHDVEKMVAEFARRRDVIVAGLNSLPGFQCETPKGAFYVFPNIEGTGRKSKELETALLEEAGVACLSGTSFGKYGEGFLRFSYANSIQNIEEAIARIAKFLG